MVETAGITPKEMGVQMILSAQSPVVIIGFHLMKSLEPFLSEVLRSEVLLYKILFQHLQSF